MHAPDPIEKLLERSVEMEQELLRYLDIRLIAKVSRDETTYTICTISFEHARSLRALMTIKHYTSAIGMSRLQYESLVKAVWVFYAANEKHISKLCNKLNLETEQLAKNMPGLNEMLKQIDNKVPETAARMLNEIKDQSWKAMNSYVHAGIHAISACQGGYSLDFLLMIIRHSNNMLALAVIQIAILTKNNRIAYSVDKVGREYKDCLNLDS